MDHGWKSHPFTFADTRKQIPVHGTDQDVPFSTAGNAIAITVAVYLMNVLRMRSAEVSTYWWCFSRPRVERLFLFKTLGSNTTAHLLYPGIAVIVAALRGRGIRGVG